MKTDDLIDGLYEMEYVGKCHLDNSFLYVLDNKGNLIAYVDYLNFGSLDTTFRGFARLKDDEKTRLLKLLFLYVSTPLEERKDEDENKWVDK